MSEECPPGPADPDQTGGHEAGTGPGVAGRAGLTESLRVEAFSDGVLAIVVTLLVLDLKAPSGGGVEQGLVSQWPAYVAYVASFAYVGVIWVNHHFLFSRIRHVDAGVLWRNLFLLFAASVLPFPTAVVSSSFRVGNSADQAVALVFYSGVAAAAVATWLAIFHYLARHPELLHGADHAQFFAEERRRAWVGLAAYGTSALVAFAVPQIALALMLVVPLFYAVTSNGGLQSPRWLRR